MDCPAPRTSLEPMFRCGAHKLIQAHERSGNTIEMGDHECGGQLAAPRFRARSVCVALLATMLSGCDTKQTAIVQNVRNDDSISVLIRVRPWGGEESIQCYFDDFGWDSTIWRVAKSGTPSAPPLGLLMHKGRVVSADSVWLAYDRTSLIPVTSLKPGGPFVAYPGSRSTDDPFHG